MANFERRGAQAKKGSLRGMIVILLIIVLLGGMLLPSIKGFFGDNASSPASDNGVSNTTESIPSTSTNEQGGEPKFVKQGELKLLDANKKELKKIDIELATTEAKRAQGLMYRSYMGPDQGMLFIFDAQQPQAFWMENTKIPLDIIYIDKNMKIVSIAKNTVPFSRQSIPSKSPAQYVLELNAGYADAYKIKEGDYISYTTL